ncbi:MAG: hypothetical protein MUC77_02810 [Chromatiaceae bacterium]|jgi:hypothetical protein|nr:hypothetical protein [Chromatiaceae bacterium]
MSQPLTIEHALLVLADPTDAAWSQAFRFLCDHPETAGIMLDTFRDTLMELGIEPSATDPKTGEPTYALGDVARAMGIPEADLGAAVSEYDPDPPQDTDVVRAPGS